MDFIPIIADTIFNTLRNMYAQTIVCEKVQAFLIQRIFHELDPRLFDDINFPIEKQEMQGHSEREYCCCTIPGEYFCPTKRYKNQVRMFYRFFYMSEQLPLSEQNYRLIVYLLEHRFLLLRKDNINDVIRKDIVDAFVYAIGQSDPKDLRICELKVGLLILIGENTLLELFVDEILFFFELIHDYDQALSFAYALEVFKYPMFHDKIAKLAPEKCKELSEFALYYLYRFILDDGQAYPLLDELALDYLRVKNPKIGQEKAQEEALYIIDQLTLLLMHTWESKQRLSAALEEYKKRLGTFRKIWKQQTQTPVLFVSGRNR